MSEMIDVTIKVPKPPNGFEVVGPGLAQDGDMYLCLVGWSYIHSTDYFHGCLARPIPKKPVVRPFTREELAEAMPIKARNKSNGDVFLIVENPHPGWFFDHCTYYDGPHKGLPVGKVVEQ